jgi:hypothetical protein
VIRFSEEKFFEEGETARTTREESKETWSTSIVVNVVRD